MRKNRVIVLTLICITMLSLLVGCSQNSQPENESPVSTTDKTYENDSYFFHFSFDDTMVCLKNLTDDAKYESVFDEPFLNLLQTMHNNYGAKFSLYAYNDNLKNVTSKYKDELRSACKWLKFGIHSTSHNERFFKTATYEQGKKQWNIFVNEIVRITGSTMSIDRMPRLHYWEGCEDAMLGMRDANSGALGFLSGDHTYPSYYLSKEKHLYAYNHDHIIDYKNGFVFVATDLRMDWFMENYSSINEYRLPTHTSIYEELQDRFSKSEYSSTLSSYLVFWSRTSYI